MMLGCATHHYDVEMNPVGGGRFERRTTVTQSGISVETDSPDRAGAGGPAAARTKVFTSMVDRATPGDVGGAGSITSFPTSLGTATVYLERFRGDDDAAGRARAIQRAAEELSTVILGWLESELGTMRGFDRFRAWSDANLRRDLENTMLYVWMAGDLHRPETGWSSIGPWSRAVQYLVERGYFTIGDVPRITAAMSMGEKSQETMALAVRDFVATRMGYDPTGPLPDSFSFLGAPALRQESFDRYFRTTELYRGACGRRERSTKPEECSPATCRCSCRRSGSSATRSSRLGRGRAVQCNGHWDAAGGKIVWESPLETADLRSGPCR
jgi:hypothetical protein